MHQTVNQQQMEDFFRYARFICDQFDIEIQLDSTKAETNGRVIRLPSVSGLSSRELDMMYAILLHEAGHIKYSDFTPAAFIQLKTEAHAALANYIEDARIENLLMKDFDGATGIFEKLYEDYSLDKDLMLSLFKIPHKAKRDIFSSLGTYLHDMLLECNKAPIVQYIGRSHKKKVEDFLNRHDLLNHITNDKIKSWDDVVRVTNLIYSKLVQEHTDKSQKLNLKDDVKAKEKADEIIKKLQEKLEQTKLAANDLREKINEKYTELSQFEDANSARIEPLKKSLEELIEKSKLLQEERRNRADLQKSLNTAQSKSSQLAKNKAALEQIQNDLTQLQEKMQQGLNGHGKPMTDIQKENLQSKIDNKQGQVEKIQSKEPSLTQEIAQAQKDVTEAQASLEPAFSGLTENDIQQGLEGFNNKMGELRTEINSIMSETKDLQNQISNLESKLSGLESKTQQEIVSTMISLDKGVSDQFGVNLLPGFEETPGWDSADAVQKEFDEKATDTTGQMVRNGGKMAGLTGSNLRDLQLLLDSSKEKVEEINLADIFKEKTNASKMPKTQVLVTKHTTDKAVVKSFGDVRNHVALTEDFDETLMRNDSKNQKVVIALEKEYSVFMRQMTQTFIKRFKFAKKDFWKGGREEGQLDARNLWKLPTRTGEDYFEENNPKFINKMAASILVDVSGSHDKEESEYGKLLKVLSVAMSKGLSAAHIKHEVLGFHAPICEDMRQTVSSDFYNRRSNKLQTLVYKNFAQKDCFGVGNMDVQCSDNSDGESIRIAVKRLAKERAKSRALFIITDAKPYLSDGHVAILDEDLKKALREAVAQKVQVFAFGFVPNGFAFYGERFCYIQNLNDVLKFCDKMAVA